ncbi:MAG TPA: formyltransferase [Thermoanaerobaculaceae bacterium]|nr:formyltransferase [Thermoanaerobaculaceae bacterium]
MSAPPGPRTPNPGPRSLVFGYHTKGCVGFDALARHGFEVAAVFTHADDPSEEVWWGSLAERARAHGIPVHLPAKADLGDDAFTALVASYRPEFVFSFYFRWMIPTRVLALAPSGAFNLHGSLLPRYRGRAPVNWVLVNGETETGVSLHAMVAKADAGDVVDQERVAIARDDTAYTLYGKLESAAATLLDRALPRLRDGSARLRPVDLARGSYFGGRTPADGRFEWSWGAERIYNLVRAVTHPYPGAFTELGSGKLLVWWAIPVGAPRAAAPGTVLEVAADGVAVATGDGALRLVTVQLEGEPELPASAFALGHAISPGAVLSAASGPRAPAPGHASSSRNGDFQ